MPVTLRIPTVLAKSAGGATVHEARGAKGQPYPYVIFYLDDEDIRFQQGFETPVLDGAEIIVVPAIAGG